MLGSTLLLALTLTPSVLAGVCRYGYDCPPETPKPKDPVKNVTCGGQNYVYQELAGVGVLPGNGRDSQGDTLAGLGSAAQVDLRTWKKVGKKYEGILYSLPDRGW
jgi:hypothetical protein